MRSRALAALLAAGCVAEPAPDALSCAEPLGGPPLAAGLPEGEPGLARAIAAAPVADLPPVLDTADLDADTRALLAFALDLPQDQVAPTLAVSDAAGVGPALRDAVLASFAQAELGALDEAFLRRGLQRYYACDRDFPPTLAAFRARYGGWDAATATAVDSTAKRAPRALRELPERGFYLAQSVDPATGGLETEVILAGERRDGGLDFLAYDSAGLLRDRARLALGSDLDVWPAPYACLLCHRDLAANTFTVVHP